jgi:predicted acyl esterase
MGAVGEPDAPGHEWRGAADWPIPARPTPYYLTEGGTLALQCPEARSSIGVVADPVRKTPLFEPFMHLNDHFAKTGSGHT